MSKSFEHNINNLVFLLSSLCSKVTAALACRFIARCSFYLLYCMNLMLIVFCVSVVIFCFGSCDCDWMLRWNRNVHCQGNFSLNYKLFFSRYSIMHPSIYAEDSRFGYTYTYACLITICCQHLNRQWFRVAAFLFEVNNR